MKFRPNLISEILDGARTTTWRVFDDKDLQVGDKVELLNWETKEKIVKAELIGVKELRLGGITSEDYDASHSYPSNEKMLERYREYYGEKVTNDSLVKIIKFKLL